MFLCAEYGIPAMLSAAALRRKTALKLVMRKMSGILYETSSRRFHCFGSPKCICTSGMNCVLEIFDIQFSRNNISRYIPVQRGNAFSNIVDVSLNNTVCCYSSFHLGLFYEPFRRCNQILFMPPSELCFPGLWPA